MWSLAPPWGQSWLRCPLPRLKPSDKSAPEGESQPTGAAVFFFVKMQKRKTQKHVAVPSAVQFFNYFGLSTGSFIASIPLHSLPSVLWISPGGDSCRSRNKRHLRSIQYRWKQHGGSTEGNQKNHERRRRKRDVSLCFVIWRLVEVQCSRSLEGHIYRWWCR